MHKRMGNLVHQDKAVTLDVIHKLIEGLIVDYLERGDIGGKKR